MEMDNKLRAHVLVREQKYWIDPPSYRYINHVISDNMGTWYMCLRLEVILRIVQQTFHFGSILCYTQYDEGD